MFHGSLSQAIQCGDQMIMGPEQWEGVFRKIPLAGSCRRHPIDHGSTILPSHGFGV